MRKLGRRGWIWLAVAAVVAYLIIATPDRAAHIAGNAGHGLQSGAESIMSFISQVLHG